jgi:long-chain fatty acid transport protein
MGVAWDESPVPDAEHRTVRIPCSDRTWLAFGLGYQPSEQWLIDAGFMWVWFEDVRINNEYAPGARVVGDFEGEAQVYSLQARYKF